MPSGVYKRRNTLLDKLRELIKDPSDQCIEWPYGADQRGYGMIWFEGRTRHTNRVAFLIVHGRYPTHFACHHCDNPRCINPKHLFDGTHDENMADGVAKGRFPKGAASATARRAQVDPGRVFDLSACGCRAIDIARWLGISQPYVSRILNGKRRNHASCAV